MVNGFINLGLSRNVPGSASRDHSNRRRGVRCLQRALPAAMLAMSGGFLAWFGRLMGVTAIAFFAVAVG